MATKNIVPRGNLEGNLGTEQKRWSGAFVGNLDVSGNTKLTFANGTITDVATQTQAEAGTDNATVMTPLLTAQEIDSKRPIKVFTSLKQLGLDNTATLEQIYNKMPDGGVANLFFNADTVSWGIPVLSCGYIFTMLNGRLNIKAFNNGEHIYERVYTSWSDVGWKRLATNGALSMPSNTRISLSINSYTANNTSAWDTLISYTAPTDGWLVYNAQQGTQNGGALISVTLVDTDNNEKFKSLKQYNYSAGLAFGGYIPVNKGRKVNVIAKNIISGATLYFYNAQSEV